MAEPHISFRCARLKVEWANIHIESLNRVCTDFVNGKPYGNLTQNDPATGGHGFNSGMTAALPMEIPLLVGDICGNLRASLDYAWMGLVRAFEGANASKKTMPIADNRKGLISTIDKAPIGAALEKAKTLLGDTVKPHRDYTGGGNRAICTLNDLANWNKHNLIVIATGAATIPVLQDGNGNIFYGMTFIGHIRSEGIDIATPTDLRQKGETTFKIVFGEGYGVDHEPVIPTLVNLSKATTKALDAFEQTFS